MNAFTILFMLISGLLIGLVAGFIMHRSDFCIAGMFRDFFLFRSLLKLRTLLLLIISSMVLFELARYLGLLSLYPFPLIGSPSLTNVIGGFFFGIGMVLAGGCVVGTLYKMGAGSVLSAVAFAGLIIGSALYAEIYPWWVSIASATTLSRGNVTIPQILNLPPLLLISIITIIASVYFLRWHRQGGWARP
ncbi:MAG: YeeE/YedE thiosulfate transporter family protein, partial [Desulfuromonadaceae bacterium]|nr:YeeE/YedE thiosulfate transporter family protein [Desulfuromonadaceae bacterium]